MPKKEGIIRAENTKVKRARRTGVWNVTDNTSLNAEILILLNKAKELSIKREDYERIRDELEEIQTFQDIQN